MFGLLKASVRGFVDDDCPTMAAALSYYTVFSLPPLLLLILLLVGALMDPQDVQGTLQTQLQSLMGPGAGQAFDAALAGNGFGGRRDFPPCSRESAAARGVKPRLATRRGNEVPGILPPPAPRFCSFSFFFSLLL